ncbi:hypothetical protein EJB05_34448, partial [Eragrostis curvula]
MPRAPRSAPWSSAPPATDALLQPAIESARRFRIPVRHGQFPVDYAASGLPEGSNNGSAIPMVHMWSYFRAMALLRVPIETYFRGDSNGTPHLAYRESRPLTCVRNIERFRAFDAVQDDNQAIVMPGLERRFEADGVIVSTFLELEPEFIAGYATSKETKVWTVGLVSLYHQQGVATA